MIGNAELDEELVERLMEPANAIIYLLEKMGVEDKNELILALKHVAEAERRRGAKAYADCKEAAKQIVDSIGRENMDRAELAMTGYKIDKEIHLIVSSKIKSNELGNLAAKGLIRKIEIHRQTCDNNACVLIDVQQFVDELFRTLSAYTRTLGIDFKVMDEFLQGGKDPTCDTSIH